MYRTAMKKLITWKAKENRKPLLIMGARQTEKAIRFSTKKYIDQDWMENIPLYAICNL